MIVYIIRFVLEFYACTTFTCATLWLYHIHTSTIFRITNKYIFNKKYCLIIDVNTRHTKELNKRQSPAMHATHIANNWQIQIALSSETRAFSKVAMFTTKTLSRSEVFRDNYESPADCEHIRRPAADRSERATSLCKVNSLRVSKLEISAPTGGKIGKSIGTYILDEPNS